jgi:hypothetical protein
MKSQKAAIVKGICANYTTNRNQAGKTQNKGLSELLLANFDLFWLLQWFIYKVLLLSAKPENLEPEPQPKRCRLEYQIYSWFQTS